MKPLHRPDLFTWSRYQDTLHVDFNGFLWVRPAGNVLVDPPPSSGKTSFTMDCRWFMGGSSLACTVDGMTPAGPLETRCDTELYLTAPAEIIAGLVRVHQYTIMSAPTTAQAAALEALEHGEADVRAMTAEYDRRRRLIVGGLNRLGLTTFEPRGAFYAFPKIGLSGMDDETFAQKLLQEEKVAVVPGSAFGAGGAGFVRCAYATAYEKIEEALVRIERFMRRHG